MLFNTRKSYFPATFEAKKKNAVKRIVPNFLSRLVHPHFRSSMANAAAKILVGLGEKSLNDDQAQDFFDWIGDLTGTGNDSDTSLDRVSARGYFS